MEEQSLYPKIGNPNEPDPDISHPDLESTFEVSIDSCDLPAAEEILAIKQESLERRTELRRSTRLRAR